MKANVVSCTIYASALDYTHGMGRRIKRLVIPERDNLIITPIDRTVYVGRWEMDSTFVEEIEVPDVIVDHAEALLAAEDALKQSIMTRESELSEVFAKQYGERE